MGGRGASSSKSSGVDNFIKDIVKNSDDFTRGDLQGVVEAYALKHGMNDEELLQKIDSQIEKKRNVKTSDLSNRQGIIDFVKHQLSIDLSTVLEDSTMKSRTYLGVHLEKLDRSQVSSIRTLLNKKGIRIESNGGLGYAIYYKKNKKK